MIEIDDLMRLTELLGSFHYIQNLMNGAYLLLESSSIGIRIPGQYNQISVTIRIHRILVPLLLIRHISLISRKQFIFVSSQATHAKLLKNKFLEETNDIILFSALDWGLGHTTRSIPLLTFFNENGCQLLIAVQPASASEKILQRHFPDAIFLPLKGYCITYAKKRSFFALKIFFQIPKILAAIRREHRFVKETVRSYPIKMILSDNRYGFYHKSVHSVFMTHQLRIAAPFSWLEATIQQINYNYIQRFDELWIPDLKGDLNIGGALSHPGKMPPSVSAHYLGPLSRLSLLDQADTDKIMPVHSLKYLFLLSGPEPQRSILEKRLLEAAHRLTGKTILIRGLPAEASLPVYQTSEIKSGANGLTVIPYADPDTLNRLLQKAEYVVCRAGYSTIMDLLILGKKGIYIPTPGQTEQQYLAKRLMQQHWGFCFEQEEADYISLLEKADTFNYSLPKLETTDARQHLKRTQQNWEIR